MVGHWEVDYHRDVGIGTSFPDVSADEIVVNANFLDKLGKKVQTKKNYKAVAAGIKRVTKNGFIDFGGHNCFIVIAKKGDTYHRLLFEMFRDQSCKLIGADCYPKMDATTLRAIINDIEGGDSFENVQLTI
ncbi:MAG: hypothetical protein GOV00_03130 [Candidatus Altiarchaeota archaeon]|nr:hypothetical protein [Candidatus Altiarchaeota archaeon]